MKPLDQMKIHIIGIGGTGMAPIASVLKEMGTDVSGSDRAESTYTKKLREKGIKVMVPQAAENITDPDYVFYSSAIHDDNPELSEARKRGIPCLKRREFLDLMLHNRKTIAIAGSHGKSTTTSMTVWVLSSLGLEPGFIVGSTVKNIGDNASAGKSDWFVIEADEYDNMFLGLTPYIAGLTKVEYDHPDCFPTQDIYLQAFSGFLAKTRTEGVIIRNADDPKQDEITYPENHRVFQYGIDTPCDLQARDLKVEANGCYSFTVNNAGETVPVKLQIPGRHNVSNALLVLSICAVNEFDLKAAAKALGEFTGIGRRFEITGEWNGITIVDDYAHHPTEIRATLKAAREYFPNRRIWAVWQPHTFSRTQSLLDGFCQSFDNADELIITDIFAARETSEGFGIEDVLAAMRHSSVHFAKTKEIAVDLLTEQLKPGDVVVTLSAGDANEAAPAALERLKHASN